MTDRHHTTAYGRAYAQHRVAKSSDNRPTQYIGLNKTYYFVLVSCLGLVLLFIVLPLIPYLDLLGVGKYRALMN